MLITFCGILYNNRVIKVFNIYTQKLSTAKKPLNKADYEI